MKKLETIKKTFASLVLVSAFCVGCGGNSTTSNNSSSVNNLLPSSGESINTEVTEPVTLKFWHGFTGADGDSMKKMVDKFNEENTHQITIEMEVYNWDTLFTKLYTTTTNARFMPHVVALGANRLANTQSKKILLEMDDVMGRFNLEKDDFIPAAYDAGLIGDHRYSFPLDMHPTAVYYNKELINEDKLPSTWDEFIAVCKEYTKDGVYGWAIPNMYSITKDIFYSMVLQEGEDILTSDNKINLNSKVAIEKLSLLEKWKYDDGISPVSVGAAGDYSLFKAGKSVFYFDGPWTINSMNDDDGLNFEYGTFPLPESVGEGSTSFSGSHQLSLINKTVKDMNTKNAAYEFINFLTSNSLDWAKAGQVPARLEVHESDEFKALDKLAPFVEEAKTAVLGHVSYKYFYESYNYMGTAVSNALNSKSHDAEKCLKEKHDQFNRFLIEEE